MFRRFPLLILGLACTCLAGCRGEAHELVPVADLIPVARWGERVVTTEEISFDRASRVALGYGWSKAETQPDGTAFRWAMGEAAEVFWSVAEPSDLELVFDGRPFHDDDASPQTIRVELGEAQVGSFEMVPGWHQYRLEVPARHWRSGDNRLRLVSSRVTKPARVSDSSDRRELAAAWRSIRSAGSTAGAPRGAAEPIVDDDRLFLPWGSRLDLFLELPVAAFLDFDRTVFRGAGRLEIEVRPEGAERSTPASSSSVSAPGEAIPLGTARPGLHRLRLRAVGGPGAGNGSGFGGVIVLRPRIAVVADGARPRPGESPPAGQTADAGARPAPPELPVPEVFVLYLVDTLRADHLDPWSSRRPVPTPHLDALAAESVVFRQAVAQSSWTKASVASIFTGLWPPRHGTVARNERLGLELSILPELLQSAGWRTEAVVTNPYITDTFGFDRGFDHLEYMEGASAADVHAAVARRVEVARREEPSSRLFLYVHVFEPHSPYDPPARWRERLAPEASAELARDSLIWLEDLRTHRVARDPALMDRLQNLYRAEIASSDEELGVFLEWLAAEAGEDAALLYLSDHGEEFLEHGKLEHGRALHSESIWVPMALRWPGLEPAVVERAVQHLDVLPTLLPRLGVAAPPGLPGRDLLGPGGERTLFSHLHLDGPERTAAVDGEHKAIVELGPGCEAGTGHRPERRRQLYDVRRDPEESVDLADERPVRMGFLMSLIRRQLGDCRIPPGRRAEDVALDAETRRSLEALGYL